MLVNFSKIVAVFLLFTACNVNTITPHTVSYSFRDLFAIGNCFPDGIPNYSAIRMIHCSDSPISSIAFLSPDELLSVNSEGQICLCNIHDDTKIEVVSLASDDWNPVPIGGDWRLMPINEEYFFAYSLEPGFIYCINKNGNIMWKKQYDSILFPILDGNNVIFTVTYDDERTGVAVVSLQGEEIQFINLNMPPYPQLMKNENYTVLIVRSEGPYSLNRSGNIYSIGPWYNHIDYIYYNAFHCRLDSSGRFISWADWYSTIVVLDPNIEEPIYIPLGDSVPSSSQNLDEMAVGMASNGNFIAVLFRDRLIISTQDEITIKVSDLDEYNMGCFHYLYIGPNCEEYMIVADKGLIIGRGNSTVSLLQYEEQLSAHGFVFTRDFERCAAGTRSGNIIVID